MDGNKIEVLQKFVVEYDPDTKYIISAISALKGKSFSKKRVIQAIAILKQYIKDEEYRLYDCNQIDNISDDDLKLLIYELDTLNTIIQELTKRVT